MGVAFIFQPSSLQSVLVRRRRRQGFPWWLRHLRFFGRGLRGRPQFLEVLVSDLTRVFGATPPSSNSGAARGRPPVGVGVFTRFSAVRAIFTDSLQSCKISPP